MGNDASKNSIAQKFSDFSLKKSGISSNLLQRHLQIAEKSRVLQLKNCKLKNVPQQVQMLSEILRNLDLSQNRITELPVSIGNFTSLKQLHLAENNFEFLPDELGLLKTLEVLNVSKNSLKALPASLSSLNSLKTLDISHNSLISFPLCICHLNSLDFVDVSSNKIDTLPDDVKYMKLLELNLNQNQLGSLNENLVECERLRVLRVEENCLQKTAFTKNFLINSKVNLISFGGNLFQEKEFHDLPGYEEYQDRYTASKRKM